MNIALRSGYVSWTELIVNCRSLNRFFRTFISYNGWTNYQTTGIDLYYEKGKIRQCTKCFRKRTVRKILSVGFMVTYVLHVCQKQYQKHVL